MIIYSQGRYIEANPLLLERWTPGQTIYKGVFETLRVYRGKVFAFQEHMLRMQRGVKCFSGSFVVDAKKIRSIIDRLLTANQLDDARIRVSVSIEEGRSVLTIVCMPLSAEILEKTKQSYQVLLASSVKVCNRMSNVKSLDYGFFLTAYEEARRKGYDEAIFLDPEGRIVEGSRTNVFCFYQGALYTPPVSQGCLNGIMRRQILRLAGQLGISVVIQSLLKRDFLRSDEVFLTNSVIEIMPVRFIEGCKRLPCPGDTTLQLQKALECAIPKMLKTGSKNTKKSC